MKLKNKKVLITGANRGIGLELAKEIVRKEGIVILTGRNKNQLKEQAATLSNDKQSCIYQVIDVSDIDSIIGGVTAIIEKVGSIDILINNAGVAHPNLFINQPLKNIEEEFSINTMGAIRMMKAILPFMLEQKEGTIVNISSVLGKIPLPGEASYSASKAALLSFSTAIREELKSSNIKIISVLPGLTKTDMGNTFKLANVPLQKPTDVAYEIVRGIEKGKKEIICGIFNRIGAKFFPRLTFRNLNRISKKLMGY